MRRWLVLAATAFCCISAAGVKVEGRGSTEAENVCWNGPIEAWKSVAGGPSYEGAENVTGGADYNMHISGQQCSSCVVGMKCQFVLKFSSNAVFDYTLTAYPELTVLLSGPALVHGTTQKSLEEASGWESIYIVSYQTWDAGKYILNIDADCPRKVGNQPSVPLRLVTLKLRIYAKSRREQHVPTPCSLGIYGRWIDGRKTFTNKRRAVMEEEKRRSLRGGRAQHTKDGIPPPPNREYLHFEPYPCTGALQPLETFAEAMLDKNIREISIVGDSHLRSIFAHLQTLLIGSFKGEYHGNTVWFIKHSQTGETLRINYYWMEGVYKEGEHGCVRFPKGDPDWPIYSNTSDIIVFSAAAWTFRFCKDPIGSYMKRLPRFMQWSTSLPHKATARFFWRTSPPFPTKAFGCGGFVRQRRSCHMEWANDFAKLLAPDFGIEILDLWPIEAPRYGDTCWREKTAAVWVKDTHYSCMFANNTKVYGEVGEAVLRVFVHALLANL